MRNSIARTYSITACRAGVAAALCFAALVLPQLALADVNSFTLRQPMNNATVRETVPIRVPRNLLNQAGYASITIDGVFLGGAAVPDRGDTVYQWDTKHSGAAGQKVSGGNTGDLPESADGKHIVQVSLFDKDSNEIAAATSTVRVLNRITTLPDGVRLVYKWRPDEVLTYRLHSVLKNSDGSSGNTDSGSSTGTASGAAVQDVYARLQRSVEDVGVAGILLRDRYTGGTYGAAALTQAFTLTSKYTTVNKSGSILAETQLPGNGKHYGYGIDEFPDRRVSAGDSWQTQMMISLPWAAEKMTHVRGQARLDQFEWQNGYPTAKIVETYTGPATFHLDPSAQSTSFGARGAMGFPGASMSAGTSDNNVAASNVTVKRTLWFAYEAGVVVREETTLTANGSELAGALSSLTAPAAATSGMQTGMGAPGGMGGTGGFAPPMGGRRRGMGGYGGAPSYPGAPSNPGMPSYPGASSYPGSQTNPDGTTNTVQSNVVSSKTLTLLGIA